MITKENLTSVLNQLEVDQVEMSIITKYKQGHYVYISGANLWWVDGTKGKLLNPLTDIETTALNSLEEKGIIKHEVTSIPVG
ncbi:hypothetical protein OAH77_04535 [Flavobacteriaceae bacterium]|nr:hypothetical protein [Flavobacteriaceae bacterium]